MDQAAFNRVAVSFAAFHAEFATLFGRKEAQRRSEQYLRRLLVQLGSGGCSCHHCLVPIIHSFVIPSRSG